MRRGVLWQSSESWDIFASESDTFSSLLEASPRARGVGVRRLVPVLALASSVCLTGTLSDGVKDSPGLARFGEAVSASSTCEWCLCAEGGRLTGVLPFKSADSEAGTRGLPAVADRDMRDLGNVWDWDLSDDIDLELVMSAADSGAVIRVALREENARGVILFFGGVVRRQEWILNPRAAALSKNPRVRRSS